MKKHAAAHHEGMAADELFLMSQRYMKKHDVASIWLHWFNAVSWLVLFVTGSALFTTLEYRLLPAFVQQLVLSIVGSRAALLDLHVGIGLLWISILLPYGFFGFKNYLYSFFRNDLMIDADDIRWLQEKPKQILGLPHHLPPQGVYNAGQKLYGMVVAAGTAAIIVSGLVMTFHIGSPFIVRWAIVLHFLGVGSIFAGLIVHVYMAAILPEERPAFFSMFNGKVSELYAYLHHHKWWLYMKEQEQQYKNKLSSLQTEESLSGEEHAAKPHSPRPERTR